MDDVTDPDSFNDDTDLGDDEMEGMEPLLSGQQIVVSESSNWRRRRRVEEEEEEEKKKRRRNDDTN